MKNHYSSTVSTVLGFCFLFFAGTTLADGELPSTYQDDVYHCEDPKSNTNLIRCDPTTYLWDIGDLNPKKKPDDSLLCEEIVKILVRAVAEANVDPGAQQASETQREVELWETIMQTSVVDQKEPCVLWAMSFGALTPYAETMGLYEERGEDLLEELVDDAVSELAMPNGQLPNFDGNYGKNKRYIRIIETKISIYKSFRFCSSLFRFCNLHRSFVVYFGNRV